MRVSGEVKFFNTGRGFGFIKRDDGEPDVFFHVTELHKANLGVVVEGHRLSFDLEQRGDRQRAVNLTRA